MYAIAKSIPIVAKSNPGFVILRRRVLLDNHLDLLLISRLVLLEQVVSLCLRRRLRVDFVQQELNA